jgi:hypothetical protein
MGRILKHRGQREAQKVKTPGENWTFLGYRTRS